jgi:cytochrome d ubiquinol oxidase subunit II
MYITVTAFLALSLILYVLLGGADFGAGIIQLFSTTPKAEKVIGKAIGPIWEANHMWLIIAVVISFMGFPLIYSTISTALHLPIFVLLIAIIIRGTAYAFKHYDAIQDKKTQTMYHRMFVWSSAVAAIFLGMTFAAMALGKIDPEANNFYDGYIAPWLNFFSISVGFLTLAIFAFLAAVYLIGENEEEKVKAFFIRKAWRWLIAAIGIGVITFFAAAWDGLNMFKLFLSSPIAMLASGLAMGTLPLLFISIQRGLVLYSRLLAGMQVLLILGVWLLLQYPNAILLANGDAITLWDSKAPDATLSVLGWALLLGSLIILPALGYLYKVFKLPEASAQ